MATIESNTVTDPSPVVPPQVCNGAERRFALGPISWEGYLAIAGALGDHSGVRLTFDDGQLELMNPSLAREYWKYRIARLIELAAEEDGIEYQVGGSTTFRRDDLLKALEPDDCYWLKSAELMRGKLAWEGDSDPPPDLVLEIEISPASINRMKIYAGLGVSEVWRFDGERLLFEILEDGSYHSGPSRIFPYLTPEILVAHIDAIRHPSNLEMQRSFRVWLAQNRKR